MIIFTKIRYKNFLATGNQWTEIDLNTYKNTLIMGHNGSGKSTFLDALTFSLFGKPFRKVNKGNVVNSINNKACVVEIEFTIGSKNYKVIRGIKPNVFEIYVNDIMLNQDGASKDYQEHLESNILRMNYKTFTQVVILGSASFVPFMQLSAADRRTVIENLLDIQIFSAMSLVVKSKLQANKDDIDKNRVAISAKQSSESYVKDTIRSLKANNEERLTKLIETSYSYELQLKDLSGQISDKEKIVDDLLNQVNVESDLRSKHTKLIAYKAKIERNKSKICEDMSFYKDNDSCPTCKQTLDFAFKSDQQKVLTEKNLEFDEGLNMINSRIDSVLIDLDRIEKLLRTLNETRMDLSSIKTTHNNLTNNLSQVMEQIKEFSTSDKSIQDSERQLSQIQHYISLLEKEKEKLLDERQYIDLGTTLLKDGGIKTRIIKQYLPIINKHINKYLTKMGFFVNFNIDETFEETIKSRYRDEFSYNNFSEGEKLRIDLAILLTWRQIAKLKNSVNVNIIVFDEILDRAMDTNGIDEFMKLMWNFDKDTNVFVISHRDTMMDRFERSLRFEKVKNFSVMSKDV